MIMMPKCQELSGSRKNEPFQKTGRPVIPHQIITGNPNIKSIDDKKVVQSSYGAEKVSHSRF